jgi:hypothetical protein
LEEVRYVHSSFRAEFSRVGKPMRIPSRPGVRIQGKIFSNHDLHVDGEVDGALEVSGHNLTVGAKATIKAEIKAQDVSIVGTPSKGTSRRLSASSYAANLVLSGTSKPDGSRLTKAHSSKGVLK